MVAERFLAALITTLAVQRCKLCLLGGSFAWGCHCCHANRSRFVVVLSPAPPFACSECVSCDVHIHGDYNGRHSWLTRDARSQRRGSVSQRSARGRGRAVARSLRACSKHAGSAQRMVQCHSSRSSTTHHAAGTSNHHVAATAAATTPVHRCCWRGGRHGRRPAAAAGAWCAHQAAHARDSHIGLSG